MEAYVPFIHHLKEIACLYRETGTVSPRTLAASENCNRSLNLTRSSLDKLSESLVSRRKIKSSGKSLNYSETGFEPKQNHTFTCKVCYATFKYRRSLNSHVKHKHEEECTFLCTVCVYTTDHKKNLKRHIRIWHSDNSSKPYVPIEPIKPVECCGRIFRYLSHLERHRRTLKHQNRFRCGQCHEIFEGKEDLKQHKSIAHFNVDGKFECLICNKKYATNGILTVHIATVHYSKRVECLKCLQKFRDKWSLQRHYNRHHRHLCEEYVCDTCGFKFGRADNLTAHKKNQCKNRPYCTICRVIFKDSDTMEKHKLTHRPCQICGMTFSEGKKRESHMKSHLRAGKEEKRTKPRKKIYKRKRKQKKEKENLCSNDTNYENESAVVEFPETRPEVHGNSSTFYEYVNQDSEARESLKEMPVYFNL